MTDLNHPFPSGERCTCHRADRSDHHQVLTDSLNGRDRLSDSVSALLNGEERLCEVHDADEIRRRAVEAERDHWTEVAGANQRIYDELRAKDQPPAEAPPTLEETISALLSGTADAAPPPAKAQPSLPLNAPPSDFARIIGGTPID